MTEKSKIEPSNIYSKNCVISEKSCKKILKNNLLILRLSNVFGLENKRKKKPSLMSLILIGLKNKEIFFDNNYYLYKDFLPIKLLCKYIDKLIKLNVKGVLNVGSGIPILVKDFVNLILNLKKIKITVKLSKNFYDRNYCYNTKKLSKLTGINVNKKKLNVYFSELKNKLI